MTETESEIQYRCPPGMRVLRVADIVQIQGGPAVVIRVTACNATVLPMQGTTKVITNRFDGTQTVINVQRGPVAVSNNMEPSQILRHMTEQEYADFLAERTPAKRGKDKPTNNKAEEQQEEVMAKKPSKKQVKKSNPKRASDQIEEGRKKLEGKQQSPRGKRADFIRALISDGKTDEEIWTATRAQFTYSDRATVQGIVDRIKATPAAAV